MNIFFDVDYTICSWNGKLRPHVKEVLQKLKEDGHSIYLWSGEGPRWEIVEEHKLHDYIIDCFPKPFDDYKAAVVYMGIEPLPDFVVDDYAPLVRAFGGYAIRPWLDRWTDDEEMWAAYRAVQKYALSIREDLEEMPAEEVPEIQDFPPPGPLPD